MRLYRFADDVATGGRLWASTMEYARELAKAGKGGDGSRRPAAARTLAHRRGAPASLTPPPPRFAIMALRRRLWSEAKWLSLLCFQNSSTG